MRSAWSLFLVFAPSCCCSLEGEQCQRRCSTCTRFWSDASTALRYEPQLFTSTGTRTVLHSSPGPRRIIPVAFIIRICIRPIRAA
jgi:hypothetical protein